MVDRIDSIMRIMVTGAFSFTGSYIARELLKREHDLSTLTGHPREDSPIYGEVSVHPYSFDDISSLEGIEVFVNTYWIRFPKYDVTWEDAVANSKKLVDNCVKSGVKLFVQISVTNPSLDSPYPYFRGKSEVEEYIKQSGISYLIVRPALIFEKEDILLNNMAYLMRKFHLFALFGRGDFKVQPIHQQDLAEYVSDLIESGESGKTLDAIGPDTYEFREMLDIMKRSNGIRALIIPFPGILRWVSLGLAQVLGFLLRDILLTKNEMLALMDDLLLTDSEPVGRTSFAEWCEGVELGKRYAHEVKRHYM